MRAAVQFSVQCCVRQTGQDAERQLSATTLLLLLPLLLLRLVIDAMPPVVVLIAVDPSDQAEAAFNCEYRWLSKVSRPVKHIIGKNENNKLLEFERNYSGG